MQAFKIYTSGHGRWKYGDLVATVTAATFADAVGLYLKHYLGSFFQRDLVQLGDGIRIAGTECVFMPYPRMRVTLDGEEVIWDFFPTLEKALEVAFAKSPRKWPKNGKYVAETYDFPLTYFSNHDQGKKQLWSIYSDGVSGFVDGQLLGQVWATTFRKAVIRWNTSYGGSSRFTKYPASRRTITADNGESFHSNPMLRVILKAGEYQCPIFRAHTPIREKDTAVIQCWALNLNRALDVARSARGGLLPIDGVFESVDLVRWNKAYYSV